MTLDNRLDAAIHWTHPRLEFHISVWFQGCEQWADLLSQVLWSRHKEGRRAKTTLLQDKDTSGGGGMVSLWLCLCVFVCLSLSVCLCVFTLSLFLFLCVSISLSLPISVPDERWMRIAWMWMTTDQRKGEIIILMKGRQLLLSLSLLLLFIIIIISRTGNRPSQLRRQILVEKTTSQKRNCDISILKQWKKLYIWYRV